MIFYDFRTYHMNFIQKKHRKLDETCLGTQGHFKAHVSNVMEVLGRLTSKLHETTHTTYKCYKKSLKDLINS